MPCAHTDLCVCHYYDCVRVFVNDLCIHVPTWPHMHAYTCACLFAYICYVRSCSCVHRRACKRVCSHACMGTHVCINVCLWMRALVGVSSLCICTPSYLSDCPCQKFTHCSVHAFYSSDAGTALTSLWRRRQLCHGRQLSTTLRHRQPHSDGVFCPLSARSAAYSYSVTSCRAFYQSLVRESNGWGGGWSSVNVLANASCFG